MPKREKKPIVPKPEWTQEGSVHRLEIDDRLAISISNPYGSTSKYRSVRLYRKSIYDIRAGIEGTVVLKREIEASDDRDAREQAMNIVLEHLRIDKDAAVRHHRNAANLFKKLRKQQEKEDADK